MSPFDLLILAVVQGVTEFLPISSSGHLVVIAELLASGGADADLSIVLHLGTLLSILVFFWRRVVRLFTADRRVLWLLLVGSVPAVLLGLLIKTRYEAALESPLLAGPMLVVTGLLLLFTPALEHPSRGYRALLPLGALVIGLFQALALLPGISRSGATIVAGLLVGLRRREAATFSFLLAIPAMVGATFLEFRELFNGEPPSASIGLMVVGCVVSFLVGLGALAWLLRWLQEGKLHYFAYWCIPVGLGVLAWQLAL